MALEWLSPRDRDWVVRNQYFLEAIWDRFEKSGEWPDPVDVLRELRAADPSRRVNTALAEMPAALARREYAPPRVILSIFGLACCTGAQLLLYQYLDVSRLALQRFDSPQLPNRLSRNDVVTKLGLDEDEADRLSQVLMSDAPFLGSGDSNTKSWDREVDPRAEEFEDIKDTEALIAFLSSQRRIAVERVATPGLPFSPSDTQQAGVSAAVPEGLGQTPSGQSTSDFHISSSIWTTVSGLATVASLVVTVMQSPSVLGVAIFGGLLGLTVGLFWTLSRRFIAILALIGVGLGVIAGVQFVPPPDHGPYRYFVASTGNAAVIVGLIEPHRGAAEARDTVLGLGDSTAVNCLRRERGELWAQLPNGSFVPAGLLTAEVGGDAAPPC